MKKNAKALDKSFSSIINFLISVEELFLCTHLGVCIDESQQKKRQTIRTYVDFICAHDTIFQSYTNATRAILKYLQQHSRVSSYTAYRLTLAISHIREIVGMFKVCCLSCKTRKYGWRSQNFLHKDISHQRAFLRFTHDDWDLCLKMTGRFLIEFRGGNRSRLDIVIMFLTANLFRGNEEKTRGIVQEVLCEVLKLIQSGELYAQDHMIAKAFAITGDITWRLHLMGTLMQLMNIVSVLID